MVFFCFQETVDLPNQPKLPPGTVAVNMFWKKVLNRFEPEAPAQVEQCT